MINTERLLLRPLTVADAKEVYEWVSDDRVSKYMVYNTYQSVEQVAKWLKYVDTINNEYNFGFVRKTDGRLIGSGSISPDAKGKGFWGFGYNFRYDCWGNGYATEATKAMMKYVYDNFGVRKFASSHVEFNKASGRVMEKCGLHFVGYGEFQKMDGSCKMRSMEYEGNMENTIVTKRLLLQPMNNNDIEFIVMLEERVESYQYDLDVAPTHDEINKRCKWFIDSVEDLPKQGAIRWIVRKENKEIGEVHFICNWSKTHEWEIGYKFLKEYWGVGYATEAVTAVIHHVFMNFEVHRIVAFLNSKNKRSRTLCERIGMLEDGCLREARLMNGIYNDEYIYSILKHEWNSNKEQ